MRMKNLEHISEKKGGSASDVNWSMSKSRSKQGGKKRWCLEMLKDDFGKQTYVEKVPLCRMQQG
jgi:hypothetical protein